METKKNKLDWDIEEFEVNRRVYKALQWINKNHEDYPDSGLGPIKTVRDLVKLKEGEILRVPNWGRKTLMELQSILDGMDLKLGMTDEEIQEIEESSDGYYTKLNYDIIKASKINVGKTVDAILNKHKWREEDVDRLFKDHEKVLAVYKKSLKELFKEA